ncbi:MAG: protease SohB [Gammaproteobacteria bacterium]|nr:protease SohB [Gammaproteobacteria bacterium]
MSWLALWGLFGLKLLTFLLLVGAFFLMMLGALGKAKQRLKEGQLTLKQISENLAEQNLALWKETIDKKAFKLKKKALKTLQKQTKNAEKLPKLYILNFEGDLQASGADSLAKEVTAIVEIAEPGDEVLVKIESPGGVVHGYGYAASQLLRLKEKGLKLTVSVDKIAASGGYLMAVVADQLLAAPFAIIGSIGVVAQLPNFNRFLKEKGVDFEQVTAGEHKRTLSLFGENTEAGREKMKEQLEGIHDQFKQFIRRARPQVNLDEIATGDHWLGEEALRLSLVDELKTSDAYILDAFHAGRALFQIHHEQKKGLGQRFHLSLAKAFGFR